MLGRLWDRYCDRMLRIDLPGTDLIDPTGRVVGRVETCRLEGRRAILAGWCLWPEVALGWGEDGAREPARRLVHPLAPGAGQGVETRVGFTVAAPAAPDLTLLYAPAPGDGAHRWPVPGVSRARRLAALAGLAPGFAATLVATAPAALRWAVTRDPAARLAVGRIFRASSGDDRAPVIPAGLLRAPPAPEAAPPAARVATRSGCAVGATTRAGFRVSAASSSDAQADVGSAGITVVLPVHNARTVLTLCLDRLDRHTDLPWRAIVVDDGSTDPAIAPFLAGWVAARPDRTELITHPRNLGFVAAANAGLARARGFSGEGPIVLLNSDALVPPGWAARLIGPMTGRPEVASVTPASNDAELMSVPCVARRIDLSPGAADALDGAARRLDPAAVTAALPTAVGFCMAIDRTWLERVPAFDAAFGAGYGEEVDWCLRTAALGAVHLGHMGLVVEHSGAASFGQGNKATRIAAASSRIRRRHPGFPRTVTRWVEDDPLGAPRLALALAWAGTAGPGAVPVHVAHSLGGGTELWLARRLAEDLGGPAGAAVVLRLGGGYRWRIEVHGPAGITAGRTDDAVALAGLLDLVGPRRLVVSSVVGDADPTGLPALLLGLAPTGTAIDVMLHDHLALSPSFALLDADSGFRGVPPLSSTDPAHRARRPDGRVVGLPAWRTEWGRLLDAAAERGTIVAFSAASRDLVAEAYPGVSDRIRVRPHELADLPAPLPPVPPDARPVLGILGNLAPHKGAGTAAALARRLAALAPDDMRDAPRLVLIGTVDPAFRLVPPARVHGAYTPGQIGPLARRYGITHWLIPSICPETFSFTTREALATGRQVLVFDLGAQAEAARAAPNGRVLPLCASDEARAEAVLAALRRP